MKFWPCFPQTHGGGAVNAEAPKIAPSPLVMVSVNWNEPSKGWAVPLVTVTVKSQTCGLFLHEPAMPVFAMESLAGGGGGGGGAAASSSGSVAQLCGRPSIVAQFFISFTAPMPPPSVAEKVKLWLAFAPPAASSCRLALHLKPWPCFGQLQGAGAVTAADPNSAPSPVRSSVNSTGRSIGLSVPFVTVTVKSQTFGSPLQDPATPVFAIDTLPGTRRRRRTVRRRRRRSGCVFVDRNGIAGFGRCTGRRRRDGWRTGFTRHADHRLQAALSSTKVLTSDTKSTGSAASATFAYFKLYEKSAVAPAAREKFGFEHVGSLAP